MDSPRQHLRSSQSRRKVRFRNNNNFNNDSFTNGNNNNTDRTPTNGVSVTTNTNSNKQNILDQGLEVSLFEGRVDQDLICPVCSRVFVQPEASSCQHVFCSSCLHSSVGKQCPTCSIPLDRTPSNQPPVNLRLKLLDLVIRCENKCGEVMPLGKLPRHVSDDCPNTPVSCPHSKRGGGTGGGRCQIKVKRCQLQEHIKECDWRPVQCEACGEKTVFHDLVLHQKRSRCVENRIRNQLVHAIKNTNQETVKHRKTLEHQRVKIESHQRRNELDHVRRLQSMKLSKRQGSWHPQQTQTQSHQEHHPSFTNDSSLSSSSSFNNYSNSNSKHGSFSSSHNNHNNNSNNNNYYYESYGETTKHVPSTIQQQEKDRSRNAFASNSRAHCNNNNNNNNNNTNSNNNVNSQSNINVFVTSTDDFDGDNGNANGVLCSIPPSRETRHDLHHEAHFMCRKCNKRVRESCNKPTSCRWHAGPIIELFGGTCYTCGRLDYQHGCMIGFHEP